VGTNVVERADVRMVLRSNRSCFTLEPLTPNRIRAGQDFDRDNAVEAGIARLIDLSHSSGPKGREDFVWAESGAVNEGHGFFEEEARLHGSWWVCKVFRTPLTFR
jgi:hypothetical protein